MKVDIQAFSRTDHTGTVFSGALSWFDEDDFRYSISVHPNPDGVWQMTETSKGYGGQSGLWIIKQPPKGGPDRPTVRLNATVAKNAKIVAYVLQQQNAHCLVQEHARDKAAREARKEAESVIAMANAIREALKEFAWTVQDRKHDIGDRLVGATESDLYGLCALPDATLLALDLAIHKAKPRTKPPN